MNEQRYDVDEKGRLVEVDTAAPRRRRVLWAVLAVDLLVALAVVLWFVVG